MGHRRTERGVQLASVVVSGILRLVCVLLVGVAMVVGALLVLTRDRVVILALLLIRALLPLVCIRLVVGAVLLVDIMVLCQRLCRLGGLLLAVTPAVVGHLRPASAVRLLGGQCDCHADTEGRYYGHDCNGESPHMVFSFQI